MKSAHTSLCACVPGAWQQLVRLHSHRADSMYFSWWPQRLHLLFAHWLSSQGLSLPFLHLLLFFCALAAAMMIQGTASATCGNQVFPVSSPKSGKRHHSWAAASRWSEHLSLPRLRVSYCLCLQERFTSQRVQQPPPALCHVPTECGNVFLTFSHGSTFCNVT